MTEVMKFFGNAKITDFRRDWQQRTATDKAQLKDGISDGTLTY